MATDKKSVKHPVDDDHGMKIVFDMETRSLKKKLDQAIEKQAWCFKGERQQKLLWR